MSDENTLFRRAVRYVLGLREPSGTTPGDPAQLWRFGRFRATVRAAAADGSTVDVDPEIPALLSSGQAIPLVQPFPGAVVVPAAGSVVWLEWEGGREDRPRATFWESGSATKIVIAATTVYLGAETGAEPLVKKSEFDGHTHAVTGVGTTCVNGSPWTGTAVSNAPSAVTGTTNVRGK